MPLELSAFAKINLGIRIIGKRPDGFHDILSVFQTVSLADHIVMEPAGRTSLVCAEPGIPLDGRNLILRAHEAFSRHFAVFAPMTYHLEKNIPTGAGLGGGSADAAAVLRGLGAVHGIACDDPGLVACAETLGSDVPFALAGGTAVVSGRGEVVRQAPWPFAFAYVVVYPGFGVSTAWAYGSLRGYVDDDGDYERMTGSLMQGTMDADAFLGALVNDFEDVVFAAHPRGRQARDDLISCGARAAFLTGSGSCLVGVFDDEAAAESCARRMTGDDRRAFAVTTVMGQ